MRSLIVCSNLIQKCINRNLYIIQRSQTTASDNELCSPTEYILNSRYPPTPLLNEDLFTYAYKGINQWQNKTFVECGMTGRSYTYAQSYDAGLRWASALQKLCPSPKGKTIAFIMPNCIEYPVLFLGSVAMGTTVTTLNPLYTPEEVSSQLSDSEAKVIIVDSMFESLAEGALQHLKKDIPIIVNGSSANGRPNVQELIGNKNAVMADRVEVDPFSTAFLPYSSGTTGKPKGVCVSHASMTNNLSSIMTPYFTGTKPALGNYQESTIAILPFFHIYGMMAILLTTVVEGHRMITLPKFDPELFISTLKKNKIFSMNTVPPLAKFMAEFPLITANDLQSMHTIVVGGSQFPIKTAAILKEKTPEHNIIKEGYGMTEALLNNITPENGKELEGTQLVANMQGKIVDVETGEALPPNKKGEVCIRGPSLMTKYLNQPEATAQAIDSEGWLHSGDIAYYDEDDYFHIVDRMKDLIKVKGFQVSPSELEETLLKCPGVSDAGVISVLHEQKGEVPKAYIVLSDEDVDEKLIHDHMARNLASYKQLDGGIIFVEDLPKSPTGKLLRRELKNM